MPFLAPATAPDRRTSPHRLGASGAAAVLLVAALGLGPLAPLAGASAVAPLLLAGAANRTCGQLEAFAASPQDWTELKVDPPQAGTFTDGNLTVTIANLAGTKTFDWSASQGVDAVFVKAGSAGSHLYLYDPEATGDTGLTSPGAGTTNQISHISFCYDHDGGGGVQAQADLELRKAAAQGVVDAGSTLAFTLTLESFGPDNATNVTLEDPLPALAGGWNLTGPDAGSCSIGPADLLTCGFGTVPVGATRTVTLEGLSGAADCGWLDNVAEARADEDIDPANNVAGASVYVACADVGIAKAALAGVVPYAGTLGFALEARSHGPDAAENVTLFDALDPDVPDWTHDNPDCIVLASVLACSFGTLAPGETRSVNVTGTASLAACDGIANQASTHADLDIDPANDVAQAFIDVVCSDVALAKTPERATVKAGEEVAFVLNVTSLGPDPATNVTLADTLPALQQGTWQLGGPDAAACTLTGLALACAFGTLAPGEVREVRLNGTSCVRDCDGLVNEALAAADVDIDPSDNAANATIEVVCNLCPRTQGFWKTHPEAWPVASLVLGDEAYTQAELLALLGQPVRRDASLALVHQLIAAKLDLRAGAARDANVTGAIAGADALLAPYAGRLPYGVAPSSAAGQAMLAVAGVLDRYTNGLLTPACEGEIPNGR